VVRSSKTLEDGIRTLLADESVLLETVSKESERKMENI